VLMSAMGQEQTSRHRPRDVCFIPDSGHSSVRVGYPLSAISRHSCRVAWHRFLALLTVHLCGVMSRDMDISRAIEGLSALAQESRLKVFRLLVQHGPDGMAAGELARVLKVPHNTMSTHLAILCRAGLVRSRKESRSIIYALDVKGTRALLTFLVQDCCRGKPHVCQPLIASALAECC